MSGGEGDDFMTGAEGADSIYGGPGADVLTDGEPRRGAQDLLSGGPGGDALLPVNKPAGKDLVSCGSGRDRVFADRADVVAGDCERVLFRFPRDSDF
jgi:Ca2+-binding RTX toxin-like protein